MTEKQSIAPRRTDEIRLKWCEGMFDGRDEDIRARTTSFVTTRAPHDCFSPSNGNTHPIPAGTRAMKEHAIVDGQWCTSYSCVECIDKYLDEEDLR